MLVKIVLSLSLFLVAGVNLSFAETYNFTVQIQNCTDQDLGTVIYNKTFLYPTGQNSLPPGEATGYRFTDDFSKGSGLLSLSNGAGEATFSISPSEAKVLRCDLGEKGQCTISGQVRCTSPYDNCLVYINYNDGTLSNCSFSK